MNSIKKYLVITLFSCGVANAGTMGHAQPCDSAANQMMLACKSQHWSFSATALYLQLESDVTNPLVPGALNVYTNQSVWNGAFSLSGSYHFNTGNDVALTWQHYNEKHNHNQTYLDPVIYAHEILGAATTHMNLAMKTGLDLVNFELGQSSTVGSKINMRLYTGLQYADVRGERAEAISANEPFGSTPNNPKPNRLWFDGVLNSKYQGVGPRLGSEVDRDIGHGFSIFAHGAVTLLAGQQNSRLSGTNRSVTLVDNSGLPFEPPSYSTTTMNFYQSYHSINIVPEFEGKLGLDYKYNTQYGTTELMAGWTVQYLASALQNNVFGMGDSGNAFVSQAYIINGVLTPERVGNIALVRSRSATSMALSGPFITAKWTGNA